MKWCDRGETACAAFSTQGLAMGTQYLCQTVTTQYEVLATEGDKGGSIKECSSDHSPLPYLASRLIMVILAYCCIADRQHSAAKHWTTVVEGLMLSWRLLAVDLYVSSILKQGCSIRMHMLKVVICRPLYLPHYKEAKNLEHEVRGCCSNSRYSCVCNCKHSGNSLYTERLIRA